MNKPTDKEIVDMLSKLANHVSHYAAMPHAHSEAHKDSADAQAMINRLSPAKTKGK